MSLPHPALRLLPDDSSAVPAHEVGFKSRPVPEDSAPFDPTALSDGETGVIATCYRLHARQLLTVALRLTGDLADAEDVVQDVFVKLPASLKTYQEQGQFSAWLTRLTIRQSLMHRRRARVRAHRGEDLLDHLAAPTVDGDPVAADRVMRALCALTPTLRHVFVLRAVHEYSHAEIGEILGIAPNTSEVRLHRAVRQLRELLEDVR